MFKWLNDPNNGTVKVAVLGICAVGILFVASVILKAAGC